MTNELIARFANTSSEFPHTILSHSQLMAYFLVVFLFSQHSWEAWLVCAFIFYLHLHFLESLWYDKTSYYKVGYLVAGSYLAQLIHLEKWEKNPNIKMWFQISAISFCVSGEAFKEKESETPER